MKTYLYLNFNWEQSLVKFMNGEIDIIKVRNCDIILIEERDRDFMDEILLTIAIVPTILYFIYSIVCYKNKKVTYIMESKKGKFTILNDKYYKIQLIFSILNCILLILESILLIPGSFERDSSTYLIFYVLTFWTINYLLKWISLKKNYAQLVN